MGQAQKRVHSGCAWGLGYISGTPDGAHPIEFQGGGASVLGQSTCVGRQSPTLGPTVQGLALSRWLTCLVSHSTCLCGQLGLALRASGAATCVVAV